MPLLHRARTAAVGAALLASGCLTVVAPAAASAAAADPAGCIDPGPKLRYLVVFDRGTPDQAAQAAIRSACGSTVVYYPQIAVAVATSADPTFADRMGRDRAYSAQAEAVSRGGTGGPARRKTDETQTNQLLTRARAVNPADRTADQWDMTLIRADQAHAVTEGSRDVVVGVLDSGIDPTHPDLAAAVDPALSAGCTGGTPDRNRQAWIPTTSPHGTHVAGIIAAADDHKGITGVAPGVRLASVKVVDDDGYIYPEYAVCGFMWAATTGMTITNSSYFVDPWMFTCRDAPGQSVVYEAVRRAVDYATSRGVLNVSAATNTGTNLVDPGTDAKSPDNADAQHARRLSSGCSVLPAGLRGIVTVSSVGAGRLKAGYSSYGLGAVDVTAPGGDRRQRPNGPGQPCVLSTVPGGYGHYCGTSMAAPHAAGVAALLASTHPHSSVGQLTRMLGQQADTIPCPADYDLNGTGVQDAYCTGYSAYNGFYGHGMVDALAAVNP